VLAKLSQAGLITRRVPTKGFNGASYIISPSPRLRLAQAASPFLLDPFSLPWVAPSNPVGELDAGNSHVQFDEREVETEHGVRD